MKIRPDSEKDVTQIRILHESAFGWADEADLVDTLRDTADPLISLVAEDAGRIVGHIMFSSVIIDGHAVLKVMGLAPMAVLPRRQREGIGSTLVRSGLRACRDAGMGAVVVLGHADYYPRFGFEPAARFDFASEYDVPSEVFMAIELIPGYLAGTSGTVRYHSAFADV